MTPQSTYSESASQALFNGVRVNTAPSLVFTIIPPIRSSGIDEYIVCLCVVEGVLRYHIGDLSESTLFLTGETAVT